MFEPDFEGKVELIAVDVREGFNLEIVGNFRVPTRAVMNAPVPEGECILGDLGKFEKRIPKKHVEKKQVKKTARGRGKEKTEGTAAPPLVSQTAGTYRSCYRRYTDYVVVYDTLEGLGVPGGGAAVGGAGAGSTLDGGKRKPEEAAAAGGELKRRKLQSKRTGPTQKKPSVPAGKCLTLQVFCMHNLFIDCYCLLCISKPQDAGFSFFDAPLSPSRTTAADAGVPKEPAAPFVKVVPDPSVQVEKTVEKTASQIFDTVDSSNNLISPNDGEGLDLRFSDVGPQKFGAGSQKSTTAEKASGSASGGAGYEGPPIQPGESELEWYYRTYTPDRSTSYHRPPWAVMQGDDISNDPSACKEILGGLGTPFEAERARSAPRRKEEEATCLRAEAEELVKAARAGAERLERDRAAFEKQKQTAEWAATAEIKQVRTLAKLLSEERKSWRETLSSERKSWKESWARVNETLFRVRQELTNAKAANAALSKEKAAAEVIAVKAQQAEARAVKALDEAKKAGALAAKALEKAKERESHASKALQEANAERTRLNQVVSSLQAEVQTQEVKVADLTARVTVAEERANMAIEARDALTSSFNQLEADRQWMRSHSIAHIVQAIMDAPEIATGLDLVKQRARDAGFKASYSRCLGHMNVMSKGGYTDQRSGFRDVDTEALLDAAVASFYDTSLSCVEKLDECLEAADYVDRLRMLYADAEEENPAGGG
ncbi:putative AH/BAR domain superfamily protein [Helianthus annuus]|nr:putative AH/BAR domain superfamily protein [Helianthus annuus]KAJ0625412.1 putative AH/BAR domain superfamily protein [Helianthus annuus]KAJ0781832.1 putative AH/BAR domain superfamily protein [Helianthus annuus]